MPLLDFEKTMPYIKKKGIAGYFQLVRGNFSDLLILNVLFILTSVPIITTGPSILALNRMTMAMVRDIPSSFSREYFRYFKKYFWDGIICGAVFLLCTGILSFSFVYYFQWAKNAPIMYLFSAMGLLCFLLIIITASFFFPMFCCVDLKKSLLLKNAFILSLSYLKNSMAVLSFIILLSVLLGSLFPYSMFFLIVGPFSFISLASCYSSWNPIKKHILMDEGYIEG